MAGLLSTTPTSTSPAAIAPTLRILEARALTPTPRNTAMARARRGTALGSDLMASSGPVRE